MRKTTADRLTSTDIGKVIRLFRGNRGEMVGLLVGIEETRNFAGEASGIDIHVGNKVFTIDNFEMEAVQISFPCEDN
jgi:hypothetical protein